MEHVPGQKKGDVVLYALSTCGWCAKTKNLLNTLGVEYWFEYVDLLDDDEREKTLTTVTKWNPDCSFPTIVINDKKCIVGFKEDKIREALK